MIKIKDLWNERMLHVTDLITSHIVKLAMEIAEVRRNRDPGHYPLKMDVRKFRNYFMEKDQEYLLITEVCKITLVDALCCCHVEKEIAEEILISEKYKEHRDVYPLTIKEIKEYYEKYLRKEC